MTQLLQIVTVGKLVPSQRVLGQNYTYTKFITKSSGYWWHVVYISDGHEAVGNFEDPITADGIINAFKLDTS